MIAAEKALSALLHITLESIIGLAARDDRVLELPDVGGKHDLIRRVLPLLLKRNRRTHRVHTHTGSHAP